MASLILQDGKSNDSALSPVRKHRWTTNHMISPHPRRELQALLLQVDIPLEIIFLNSPRPILILCVIIFLHSNLFSVLRHALHPSHVPQARPALVRLRDGAFLRRLVDLDSGFPSSIVPEIGVAPVLAFVLVGEFDLLYVVDAPGDEAGALALVKVPRVDVVFGVAGVFVRVVVPCAGDELAGGGVTGVEVGCGFGVGGGGEGDAGRQ